jgi:hypothetical protein
MGWDKFWEIFHALVGKPRRIYVYVKRCVISIQKLFKDKNDYFGRIILKKVYPHKYMTQICQSFDRIYAHITQNCQFSQLVLILREREMKMLLSRSLLTR